MYQYITYMDMLVDLSPGTFSQYQKVQANKWLLEAFPNKKDKSTDKEENCDDNYLDTYEEFPVETGVNFFDAEEEIDFEPSVSLCDVLNMDSICQGIIVLDFTGTDYACNSTEQDPAEVNLAHSVRTLCVLLDGAVLTPVALTTADILAYIIFDTGAISYFADDPTPLAMPTQLGGMGNGLHIERVGTVTWTCTAKYKFEIQLLAQAYYVPAEKARLLSPQKLFDKKLGVFGHFYGDEDKFTIQVGNCSEVEVPCC
jgi:hypothetical protein